MLRVLAVDLGASSLRVAAINLDANPPQIDIVHRYAHEPARQDDGSLRWDWTRLVDETVRGLEAGMALGPTASIGVDTWGVDYGLLDAQGELISPPYCYRDPRTDGWRTVVERIGAERLYRTAGIQLMAINTLFQLAAHDRGELARASRLLMLPGLMVHALTGVAAGERTSAGTTGLVDLTTGDWSRELLSSIDVDPAIMPRIEPTGSPGGAWRGVPVQLVAGHDTASAFAAAPVRRPNTAVISSGTWMLLGVQRDAPDVSDAAMRANFSNEPAAFGGVRLLKNAAGMWLLERCRAQWGSPPVDELLAAAAARPAGPTFDASDARFLAPVDMEAEIRAGARLSRSAHRATVVRCILDSLALAAASVFREIEALTRMAVPEIVVVGGGAGNMLLNRLIAEASGRSVRPGRIEATALGNALVQGVALGRWASLPEARAALAAEDGVRE